MKELNFTHSIFIEDKKLNSKFVNYINSIELKRDFEQINNFSKRHAIDFNQKVLYELNNVFNQICLKLNKEKYNLVCSCVQKYNEHDWHQTHVHDVNDYSFIYFIDCTKDSSPTTFYTPGHPYVMEEPIHVVAKKGRCVIFKGGIPHEVRPNNDNVRKVVSGNIKFI